MPPFKFKRLGKIVLQWDTPKMLLFKILCDAATSQIQGIHGLFFDKLVGSVFKELNINEL